MPVPPQAVDSGQVRPLLHVEGGAWWPVECPRLLLGEAVAVARTSSVERKDDPILGTVRRCSTCREWWPDDDEFYYSVPSTGTAHHRNQCRACVDERRHGRATPLRPKTHGSVADIEAKKQRDRERKAAVRRDPILGDKMRERQRLAQQRYYERNRVKVLERHRARYVERVGHEPTPGTGRPRVYEAEARAA